MLQDPKWESVSKSYDPLLLYSLIEKIVLKQTDEEYPFAGVCDQLVHVMVGKQGTLTNHQWYERFNTRCETAKSCGVRFDVFPVLWDYCAGLLNNGAGVEYKNLSEEDQKIAKQDSEERFLSYVFLTNSNAGNDTLKRELKNDFIMGMDQYPEDCSTALMFLDRYAKSAPPPSTSERTSFAQKGPGGKKGGDTKKDDKDSDKKKDSKTDEKKDGYKEMECFRCSKKGHPARFCPNAMSDSSSTGRAKSNKSLSKQ